MQEDNRRKTLAFAWTWRKALMESDLPASAKHVGLTLSMHMSEAGDSCFPSVARLMRETSRGRTTVLEAVAALEAAGLLVVERDSGRVNHYIAAAPDPSGLRRPAETSPDTGRVPVRSQDPRSPVEESISVRAKALTRTTEEIAPSKKARKRDLLWDAFVEETDTDPELERGKINAALKLLRSHSTYRKAVAALGPDEAERLLAAEVPRRALLYRRRWPDVELTPTALARNWIRITKPLPGAGGKLTSEQMRAKITESRLREERDDVAKRGRVPGEPTGRGLPTGGDE